MEIEIGKVVSFKKRFSEKEITAFAKISGDKNLIHLDEDYAKQSIFGRKIVHGMLVASQFSTIFGTIYPGQGGIYLSQSLKFLRPVYPSQEITATVTLVAFDSKKNRGLFKTESKNEEGKVVLTGEAKILFPNAE